MTADSGLRLELLGGFRVLTASRFAGRAPNARQQELIAFLILHARRAPVPRQRIAGSLWPESNDAQALTNLRRELHHLRDAWPGLEALIDVGSRTLAWRDDTGVPVDIVAFAERYRPRQLTAPERQELEIEAAGETSDGNEASEER